MQDTQDEDAEDDEASTPTGVRHLGRVLRGQKSLGAAAGLLRPASPQLTFDGRALRQVDAFGAVFLRAAVDVHLARGPAHSVSLIEPEDPAVFGTLHDLMGGLALPSRCSWAGLEPTPRRSDQVVVPAGPLVTQKDLDAVVDFALPAALSALGHGQRVARVAQEAAAVLLDNAIVHGGGSPMFCTHFDAATCNVQVVVFDRGGFPSDDDGSALRDVVARIRDGDGGLSGLSDQRYKGVMYILRLSWGRGRASYPVRDRRWRSSSVREALPAFVGSIEINR